MSGYLFVQLAYSFDRGFQLRESLELTQYIQSGVECFDSLVVQRQMCDAVVGILILVVFIVAHHYRSVIAQTVAAHQCQVVLERATAHRIAPAFVLSQGICARVDEIIDGPSAVVVLQTFVNRGDSYQC